MPTNVTAEYNAAQLHYERARTVEEKMAALKDMLAECPKHKGTEHLLADLRHRLAKLKEEQIVEKKKRRGKKSSLAVQKLGFQICIIGFPNSGKSTLLTALTNAQPRISPFPFTTKIPEVGMLDYNGAQVQLVEIPALIKGAAEKQGELLGTVANADGIIMMLGEDSKNEEKVLRNELALFRINKPILLVHKGKLPSKPEIFKFFNLIRVYTKEPGEEPNRDKPIVLIKGRTVLDAAREIHKDFEQKLDYARVWGSAKFPGQRVEKNFKLSDSDVVEFHI